MSEQDTSSDVLNALGSFLDQEEMYGFQIREWTPMRFAKLHPEIKQIVSALLALGITFENYKSFLTDHWQDVVDVLVPMMPQIILKSCPGKTEADLEKLSWLQAIEVMMSIFVKNITHVADFFEQRVQNLKKTSSDLTTPSSQS